MPWFNVFPASDFFRQHNVVMSTVGQRAVGLPAKRTGPKEKHVVGERATPDILVPFVLCGLRGYTVRRVVYHGHRHWVPGGSHAGVHWRDQRAKPPRHVGHVRQLQRRVGTFPGVRPWMFSGMANGHAYQLSDTRDRCRGHICGNKNNVFFREIISELN